MSGGRLVLLDRLGRDVKAFALAEGLATIGSDAASDIRVMLPSVAPHHATIVVHDNQTVVRSVASGETLVNGVAVSVYELRHGDLLGVGGRTLRWEYDQKLLASPEGTSRKSMRGRRQSSAQPAQQQASMPASSGGKQVAIVQPQRRHTTIDLTDLSHSSGNSSSSARSKNASGNASGNTSGNASSNTSGNASSNRPRSSRNNDQESEFENVDTTHRKSTPRASPRNTSLSDTKASLWIESRKTPRTAPHTLPRALPHSARKSTPLRLAVLRRAQSAHKMRVTKIQAPSKIDHTKQAAIMLMTGHTPKPKQPAAKQTPSFVVTKPSPVRNSRGRKVWGGSSPAVTPKRFSTRAAVRSSEGSTGDTSMSNLQSPMILEPKKSALKKSSSKRSMRKAESIKFDLSNLENSEDRSSDVVFVIASEDEIELKFSDSLSSPSPRRPIHSRSSSILEKSLGETYKDLSFSRSVEVEKSLSQSVSPWQRKSSRGRLIMDEALKNSLDDSRYSGSSKSMIDQRTTNSSTRKTRTRNSRLNDQKRRETYSIVDLVSIDSTGSDRSIYGSAGSETSAAVYATPGRSTRGKNSSLLSTPYVDKGQGSETKLKTVTSPFLRSRTSSPQVSVKSRTSNLSTKRSVSLTTPKNTQNRNFMNSTRILRTSRSRSRINDSDIQLIDDENASPKSSRRISKPSLGSPIPRKTISLNDHPESVLNGTSTPENRHSPEEATTPVLSIQDFLDKSTFYQSSLWSQKSQRRGGANLKRNTIGGDHPPSKKLKSIFKSRSLDVSSRRSLRATTSTVNNMDLPQDVSNDISNDENDVTTPKSGILPIQEDVKNKHSTAKKSQSKRYIIDNLDESNFVKQLFNSPVKRATTSSVNYMDLSQDVSNDISHDENDVTTPKSGFLPIREDVKNKHSTAKKSESKRYIIDNLDESNFVKQLFNSPVKRKLSQSMTEFSRKKLFEDDDIQPRLTRRTRAYTGRTPDNSLMERTDAYTPDVRPLSTPGKSPNTTGLERHFDETPENDRRNSSVQNILRSPRTRRSVKNDLTDVEGVKQVFARSPKNRLSDVRGVKELFKNKKSISSNLRNVSGVKSILSIKSPKNDLSDVRGVKRLYRETDPKNNLSDVSGVEELFYQSQDSQDSLFDDLPITHENQDLNTTFDQLIGKPPMRAYTKSKSFTKSIKPKQKRNAKSLHDSISMITENVEEWLQSELNKCVHNKSNLTRELRKLTTNTVEGNAPILLSRSRNNKTAESVNSEDYKREKSASEIYSIHTLPIKKRPLDKVKRHRGVKTLPIKEGRVRHSTPLKSTFIMSMNASEISPVSPIANVTPVGKIDGILRAELSKSTRIKTSQMDDQLEIITLEDVSPEIAPKKISPKRTLPNQPSPKVTRATKAKRRASLVITKKKPIVSPKSNKTSTKTDSNVKNIEVIPRISRSVRQVKVNDKLKTSCNTKAKKTIANEEGQDLESKSKKKEKTTPTSTPKELSKNLRNTRARAGKTTVAVTKPSPKLKLKRTAQSKMHEQETRKEVRTRQRKLDVENKLDLAIENKQSRGIKNAKNLTDGKTTTEKPKTKIIKQNVKSVYATTEIAGPSNRRNKKDLVELPIVIQKNRRVKISGLDEKITETSSIDKVGIKTRRGVNSKTVTFKDDVSPNRKGTNVRSENDGIKVTRSNKGANDTVKTTKKITEGSVESGKRVVQNIDIEPNKTVGRRTRNLQSDNTKTTGKNNVSEGKKGTKIAVTQKNRIGQKNYKNDEILNSNVQEGRQETAVGIRTRNMQKSSKNDEEVKGDKNNGPERKIETLVGRRTRNLPKKDDSDEKNTLLEEKMVVDTYSRRNKTVVEAPVVNTKGKKTTEPEKESTRDGRAKKNDVKESTNKEAQIQEASVPARRKRKVDVDETVKEAPAKRLRSTRATAALEEPAAVGRSRRR